MCVTLWPGRLGRLPGKAAPAQGPESRVRVRPGNGPAEEHPRESQCKAPLWERSGPSVWVELEKPAEWTRAGDEVDKR